MADSPNEDAGKENALTKQGTVLLAAIIDSLGAVFHLLVDCVKYRRKTPPTSLDTTAFQGVEDACRLLSDAKNQLISEADGAAVNEKVGPVLTPEAITFMLLERLTGGVYGNDSVRVIDIYEECLEALVWISPSERILQVDC